MRKGIIESVNIAIESIRQRDDLLPSVKDAVIRTLDNISQRDYYVHWTKDSIIEALRDYKRRTGRAPTVTNLTETGMPKSLSISSPCFSLTAVSISVRSSSSNAITSSKESI